MRAITTHVLDTDRGRPAPQIPVTLFIKEIEGWRSLAKAETNEDGRIEAFKELALPLRQGIYQLHFELDKYFVLQNRQSFYPEAQIIFKVDNPTEHFHVPLLLCGFGFSTYRGS